MELITYVCDVLFALYRAVWGIRGIQGLMGEMSGMPDQAPFD